jgi:hypothetical protein
MSEVGERLLGSIFITRAANAGGGSRLKSHECEQVWQEQEMLHLASCLLTNCSCLLRRDCLAANKAGGPNRSGQQLSSK